MLPSHQIFHPQPSYQLNTHSIKNKHLKGLSSFSHASQLISKYVQNCQAISQKQNFEQKSSLVCQLKDICEQLLLVLNQMLLSNFLAEQQRLDCLQQSLQMILKYQKVKETNEKRQKKQKQFYSMEFKYINNVQAMIVQKISNIIIKYTFPDDITLNKISNFTKVIINTLLQLDLNINKGRAKQSPRCNIKYHLSSGRKIDLLWYLILKLIQKQLQSCNEDNISSQNCKKNTQLQTILIKKVYPLIVQVVTLIIQQYKEYQIHKQLLQITINYLYEIQLPIIPFVFKIFYQTLRQGFTDHYIKHRSVQTFNYKSISTQICSLQNIMTMMSISQHVISLQKISISRQIWNDGTMTCSYCGIERIIQIEQQHQAYYKISVELNSKDNMIIKICKNCSNQLIVQNKTKIKNDANKWMLLAPLIYSKLLVYHQKSEQIQMALKRLLKLHAKQNSLYNQMLATIEIKQTIAMNSSDEKASIQMLDNVHKTFILTHSQLNVSLIIIELFRMMISYCAADDYKLRQKALRAIFKTKILMYVQKGQYFVTEQVRAQVVTKVTETLKKRLLDSQLQVRIAALQCFSQVYDKYQIFNLEQFLEILFVQINKAQKQQFVQKSLIFLQSKLFDRRKPLQNDKKQKQIQFYRQCQQQNIIDVCEDEFKNISQFKDRQGNINLDIWVKLMKFCIKYMNLTQNQSNISNHLEKLFHKLLKIIAKIQLSEDQRSNLLYNLNITSNPSLSAFQNIIIYILSALKLQIHSFSLKDYIDKPIITTVIDNFMQQKQPATLKTNILHYISSLYQQIDALKQRIKTNQRLGNSYELKRINSFIHTNEFIQYLLIQDKELEQFQKETDYENRENIIQANIKKQINKQKLPIIIRQFKLQILQRILHYNCLYQIVIEKRQPLMFLHLMKNANKSKTKNKKKDLVIPYQQIVINYTIQEQLAKLAHLRMQETKICGNGQIYAKVKVLVTIMMILNRIDSIDEWTKNYIGYIIHFSKCIDNLNSKQNSQARGQLINYYNSIARCFIIVTSLITQLQQYKAFSCQLNKYIDYHLNNQIKQTSNNNDSIQQKNCISSSHSFQQAFDCLISFLQQEISTNSSSSHMNRIQVMLMNLLKYYWQANPLISKISKNLSSIELIKNLYALFNMILPCKHFRILSLINHSLIATFHQVIYLEKSTSFNQDAFKIIYHMLKSGMTNSCHFNKYIFYGLLFPSRAVNFTVLKIIKEIYHQQSSEKLLYLNLSQSLNFAYELYSSKDYFYNINFNQDQLKNLDILYLTLPIKKNYLSKQKYQLKISSSFIKKLGELLIAEKQTLQLKPLYIFLIFQFIKNCTTMDYSQLVQIIFSVHKIVSIHYPVIESIKQQKGYQNQHLSQQQMKNITNFVGVFREIVHWLTVLTNYEPVTTAIKKYNRLMDLSNNPYFTLHQQIQLRMIDWSQDKNVIINLLLEDIDLFIEILVGVTQIKIEKYDEQQIQSNFQNSESVTDKTKLKNNIKKQRKRIAGPLNQKIIYNKRTKIRKNYDSETIKSQEETEQIESKNPYKNRLRQRKTQAAL